MVSRFGKDPAYRPYGQAPIYERRPWEYPREEPHYLTFPAVDVWASRMSGGDYPVSGDLTALVRRQLEEGVTPLIFRDEDESLPRK